MVSTQHVQSSTTMIQHQIAAGPQHEITGIQHHETPPPHFYLTLLVPSNHRQQFVPPTNKHNQLMAKASNATKKNIV
jgi:hypothetical protein